MRASRLRPWLWFAGGAVALTLSLGFAFSVGMNFALLKVTRDLLAREERGAASPGINPGQSAPAAIAPSRSSPDASGALDDPQNLATAGIVRNPDASVPMAVPANGPTVAALPVMAVGAEPSGLAGSSRPENFVEVPSDVPGDAGVVATTASNRARAAAPDQPAAIPGRGFASRGVAASGGTAASPALATSSAVAPGSETAANAADQPIVAPEGNVEIPAAFQPTPGKSKLTAAQQEEVTQVQDQFVAAIGDAKQDPSDPAYLASWKNAQWQSDQLFRARFGNSALLDRQVEANRHAPDSSVSQ